MNKIKLGFAIVALVISVTIIAILYVKWWDAIGKFRFD